MVANGDGHKPIWISEMNWNAGPIGRRAAAMAGQPGRAGSQFCHWPTNEFRADWPWLGVAECLVPERATDLWEQNSQPEAYFRLLAPDFSPQPVYDSLQSYIAREGIQE